MAILMTARMEPELMTCRDVSSAAIPWPGRLGILRRSDQAIVERSLAQVGGMEFADRPFSAISDGQRQRILLARALCQEPEIIVLTSPPASSDIRYKLELLTVLKRMVRENHLAVLLSLHELELPSASPTPWCGVAGDRIDRIGPPEETSYAGVYRKAVQNGAWEVRPLLRQLEFCAVSEYRHGKQRGACRQRGSRRPGAADPQARRVLRRKTLLRLPG